MTPDVVPQCAQEAPTCGNEPGEGSALGTILVIVYFHLVNRGHNRSQSHVGADEVTKAL